MSAKPVTVVTAGQPIKP